MPRTRFSLPVLLAAGLLLGGCVTDMNARSAAVLPNEPALVSAGDRRRAAGDLSGAAALYRSAHDLRPEAAEPLIRLGETLSAAGAYGDAVEAFRAALTRAPENPSAQRGMGNALVGLGQPGLAVAYFETALRLAPEDPRGYLGLGVAHDLAGDPVAAQESYRAGLALAPGDTTPIGRNLTNNLGLSLALAGDGAASVETLRAIGAEPGAPERYRNTLAIALALAGRETEAAALMAESTDGEAVARNLSLLRAIGALTDHRRKALAIAKVYAGG